MNIHLEHSTQSTYCPVLSSIHVHLRRGTEDRDGGDEAAGDGHGGGEYGHLFAGEEVLPCGVLTSPGEHQSYQDRAEEGGGQDEVFLPSKL